MKIEHKELKEKLNQARALIDECLAGLGAKIPAKQEKAVAHAAAPKSLSDHIMLLRDSGFFSQPRTVEDVHEKLNEHYFCEKSRVAVELFRIQKKTQLRKTSKPANGAKLTAYVW